MLEDSRKAKPIRHWAEGLSQVADAGAAGYFSNKVDQEGKSLRAADAAALASLLSGGSAPPAAPTSAPAPVATPSGAVVADAMTDKSLPRGFRNQNPGNIEDGPFARSQPGYAGSDGRFAKFASMDQGTGAMGSLLDSYGRKGINTVGGIINRWAPASDGNNVSSYAQAVAKATGVDPTSPIDMANPEIKQKIIAAMAQHENGRPLPQAPVAQAMAPPQMPAGQSGGGLLAGATPQQREIILKGMQASEGSPARAIATAMMQNLTKADGPTDEIKEYNLAKSQGFAGSFVDFKTGLKKAGATNVVTNVEKGENSFATEAGKVQAKRFDELAGEGQKAKQMVADIDTLTELGKSIGTGKGAEVLAKIGPWAESIGVPVKGLSEIQAFEGIVNRVAPSLRVPGSGAQSDFELKNFLKSLPALGNTPEGNAIASATMKGLQENKIKAAEIGSKALNGEITRPQAEKMLRELPDPMDGYRAYAKANKGASAPTAAPTKPAVPQAGEIRDGYRFKGGNPADQKNWEQIS